MNIDKSVFIVEGAKVLDNVVIGDNCIIGAGSLITQNKVIPSGSLVYGNPAKIVRNITQEEIEHIIWNANDYVNEANKYKIR